MSDLLFGRQPRSASLSLLSVALQVTGCGSPEERAQSYYEDGMKLLAAARKSKGSNRISQCAEAEKGFAAGLAGSRPNRGGQPPLEGLVPVLRTIVELDPKDGRQAEACEASAPGGAIDQSLKLVNEPSTTDTNERQLLALKAAISTSSRIMISHPRGAGCTQDRSRQRRCMMRSCRRSSGQRRSQRRATNFSTVTPVAQTKNIGVQLFKIKILRTDG